MPKLTVSPRKTDIELFARKAERGEIPREAVAPLALVFAATRKAQIEVGPGHAPLDAFVEALPSKYVTNWLRKRGAKI